MNGRTSRKRHAKKAELFKLQDSSTDGLDLIKQLLEGTIFRTYDVVNLAVDPNGNSIEEGEHDLHKAFEKQWEFIEPKLKALINQASTLRAIEELEAALVAEPDREDADFASQMLAVVTHVRERISELRRSLNNDPIECIWCSDTFTNKIALANHFDNVHKGKL